MNALLTGSPADPLKPFSPGGPASPLSPSSPGAPTGPGTPDNPLGPGKPSLPIGPEKSYYLQMNRVSTKSYLVNDDLNKLFSEKVSACRTTS